MELVHRGLDFGMEIEKVSGIISHFGGTDDSTISSSHLYSVSSILSSINLKILSSC